MVGTRQRVKRSAACPASEPLAELAERVLPGSSPAVEQLRGQVLRVCADPAARAILLRDPIGAEKSTIARLIGFAKRIAPLREAEARQRLEDLRFEGPGRIDAKLMPWYVEFTVTGQVEELASAQLFGIKKGVAKGVQAGPGVFERSQTNQSGRIWDGAAVTGGVVFLDEIADLTPVIQAKLLPVLSGAPFYCVGGEGDSDFERSFDGVVVAATWQPLDASRVRPDLLSRISAHVIDVPGIQERREDLPLIVEGVRRDIVDRYRARVEQMVVSDKNVDRAFWEAQAAAAGSRTIDPSDLQRLARVEWSRYGDMRGLVTAVERILIGQQDADEVLEALAVIDPGSDVAMDETSALYTRLMAREPDVEGLSGHVREAQRETRTDLKRFLLANAPPRARLAARLGIDEKAFLEQVRQLDRSRRKANPRRSS